MVYKNIDDLDAAIERIISRKVKHYYSDWKKYDRLKYMCLKGSSDKEDKKFLILARTCGTYIVKIADIKAKNDWACALYDYYQTDKDADYYYVNLNKLECKKIDKSKILHAKESNAHEKLLRLDLRIY